MSTNSARQSILLFAALTTGLLLCVLCYAPSLSGPFIFDDIPHLQRLGDQGGLTSVDNLIRFVGGNDAGPLGRPLSMLTFALNAQAWPASPLPFRLTNLALHLLCGLTIFILSRQLFRLQLSNQHAGWLAVACMLLWLLHPLLVSTTAYVIQRMTQLSSLFTLLGLVCYLRGRLLLHQTPFRAWAWLLGGMGGFGLLAVLSKENGILLPAYALSIELSLFAPKERQRRRSERFLLIALLGPLILAAAYIGSYFQGLDAVMPGRNFTARERLLTEAVVLVDYLRASLIPQVSGLGIIHDDFPVSRGWLTPPETLASILILAGLFAVALSTRRKWPYLSMGLLWFLLGHSLEAGPLPLELYFEHRNYLPLAGLCIAVIGSLAALPPTAVRYGYIAITGFIGLCALITAQTATLWGDEKLMTRVMSQEHPQSIRAQQELVRSLVTDNRLDEALEITTRLSEKHPENGSALVYRLYLECMTGRLSPESIPRTLKGIRKVAFDTQIPRNLYFVMVAAHEEACAGLDASQAQTILKAALDNPHGVRRGDYTGAIHYHLAESYKKQRRMGRAIQALDAAYDADPNIEIRITQIAWLLEYSHLEGAQYYLNLAREHQEPRPWLNRVNRNQLDNLQLVIDRLRNAVPTDHDEAKYQEK